MSHQLSVINYQAELMTDDWSLITAMANYSLVQLI